MFVILSVSTGSKEKGVLAGVAVGAVIALEALFAGPISGASMNPARSLAPAMRSSSSAERRTNRSESAGPSLDPLSRVVAWRLALGREPSKGELKSGVAFMSDQVRHRSTRDPGKPKTETQQLALADFCQAIFAMSEFIYVD